MNRILNSWKGTLTKLVISDEEMTKVDRARIWFLAIVIGTLLIVAFAMCSGEKEIISEEVLADGTFKFQVYDPTDGEIHDIRGYNNLEKFMKE